MSARYAVTRCTKQREFVGPVHWSDDAETTLCGRPVDEKWWVLSNDFSGEATCKNCRRLFVETREP